jgi:uroporphyrinogen-III synthase
MGRLFGIGVLVTRPEHQALPLCQLLESEGAVCHRFATTQVGSGADPRALSAELGPLERYDLIVFVSANAVRFGLPLLGENRGLELAALGPATARTLRDSGYSVAVEAATTIDSEGLLAHPRLQEPRGRRILLVKGRGGRDLLAAELTRRGAVVHAADVYARRPATPSADELAQLEALFASHRIQVITATSLEIGSNLLELATPALREAVNGSLWLVASERIGSGLRQLGLAAPLLEAASAQDQDLRDALLAWHSHTQAPEPR